MAKNTNKNHPLQLARIAGATVDDDSGIWTIPVDKIDSSPFQPRVDLGDLVELRESMDQNGQAVPVSVRIVDGRFELLHGHRRVAAAKLEGDHKIRKDSDTDFAPRSWDYIKGQGERKKHEAQSHFFDTLEFGAARPTVLALIDQVDDAQAARIVMGENQARKDLTPLELARAAKRFQTEGLKGPEIQSILGRSQPAVANAIRAIDILPQSVLELVESGLFTLNATRPLLAFDPRQTEDPGHRASLVGEIENVIDNALPDSIQLEEHSKRPQVVGIIQVVEALTDRLGGKRSGRPEPRLVWRPLDDVSGKMFRASLVARELMELPSWEVLGEGVDPETIRDFGKGFGRWTFQNRKWDGNRNKFKRDQDKSGGKSTAKKSEGESSPTNAAAKRAAAVKRSQELEKKFGVPIAVLDVSTKYGYSLGSGMWSLPDAVTDALARIPGYENKRAELVGVHGDVHLVDWKSVRGAVADESGFENPARRAVATQLIDSDSNKAIDVVTDMEWLAEQLVKKADKLDAQGELRREEAIAVTAEASKYFTIGRGPATALLAVLVGGEGEVPLGLENYGIVAEENERRHRGSENFPTAFVGHALAGALSIIEEAVTWPNGAWNGPDVDWDRLEVEIDTLDDRSVELLAFEFMVGSRMDPGKAAFFTDEALAKILQVCSPILKGTESEDAEFAPEKRDTPPSPSIADEDREQAVAWVGLPSEWFTDTGELVEGVAPKTMARWTEREWLIPEPELGPSLELMVCRSTHTLDAMPKYIQNAEIDEDVVFDGKEAL